MLRRCPTLSVRSGSDKRYLTKDGFSCSWIQYTLHYPFHQLQHLIFGVDGCPDDDLVVDLGEHPCPVVPELRVEVPHGELGDVGGEALDLWR